MSDSKLRLFSRQKSRIYEYYFVHFYGKIEAFFLIFQHCEPLVFLNAIVESVWNRRWLWLDSAWCLGLSLYSLSAKAINSWVSRDLHTTVCHTYKYEKFCLPETSIVKSRMLKMEFVWIIFWHYQIDKGSWNLGHFWD